MKRKNAAPTEGLDLTQADVGFLLTLQLLSEANLSVDPQDDGSAVSGRALGILGAWARLGRTLRGRGTPFHPSAAQEIARLRALVARAEPVLSRIAKPLRPPG